MEKIIGCVLQKETMRLSIIKAFSLLLLNFIMFLFCFFFLTNDHAGTSNLVWSLRLSAISLLANSPNQSMRSTNVWQMRLFIVRWGDKNVQRSAASVSLSYLKGRNKNKTAGKTTRALIHSTFGVAWRDSVVG